MPVLIIVHVKEESEFAGICFPLVFLRRINPACSLAGIFPPLYQVFEKEIDCFYGHLFLNKQAKSGLQCQRAYGCQQICSRKIFFQQDYKQRMFRERGGNSAALVSICSSLELLLPLSYLGSLLGTVKTAAATSL